MRFLAATVFLVLSLLATPVAAASEAVGLFAGGCFWCLSKAMKRQPGVLSVETGYTGGTLPDPTYSDVIGGNSGHMEAVRIVFDPDRTSYGRLLRTFWLNIDPIDGQGQFCERGPAYGTVIFPMDADQRRIAERSRRRVAALLGTEPATRILDPMPFWPAEDANQDYAERNPSRFDFYVRACGRTSGLRRIWTQQRANSLTP